jgi:hypothetical protein
MTLLGDLSRPENCAELAQRRRILRILNERGGCWACQLRDKTVMAWGRSVCQTPKRAWPACTSDGKAPAFTLDPDQLKDMA